MLDICIPCYNGIDAITFGSFMAARIAGDRTIYIVEGKPDIVEVRNELARKVADGPNPWSLWVDADIGFSADSILKLAETLERNPKAGIATGIYRGRSYPYDITVFNFVNDSGKSGFGVAYPDTRSHEPYPVDVCGAGFMMVNNIIFRQGINFDKIDKYSEDFSFCIRVRKAGYSILACPDILCTHRSKTIIEV
jgi:GT2 family glycosyltransferase